METISNFIASSFGNKKYNSIVERAPGEEEEDDTLVELGDVSANGLWVRGEGPYTVPICEGGYFIHASAHYLFARDHFSPLYATLLEGTYPLPLRCNDWVEATEKHVLTKPETLHVIVRDDSPIARWMCDRLFSLVPRESLQFLSLDAFSRTFGIYHVPIQVMTFFCVEQEGNWLRIPLWVYIAWYAAHSAV